MTGPRCPRCNHTIKDVTPKTNKDLTLNEYLRRTGMDGEVVIQPCGHVVPYSDTDIEEHFV